MSKTIAASVTELTGIFIFNISVSAANAHAIKTVEHCQGYHLQVGSKVSESRSYEGDSEGITLN